MTTNAILVTEPPVFTGPDAPGWKLTHIEPPNGHGHAFDYYACPRCRSLFVVPVEHRCITHPTRRRRDE